MKFEISNSRCCYCGACIGVCPHSALYLHHSYLEHIPSRCVCCRKCETTCPPGAIAISKDESKMPQTDTTENSGGQEE